MPTVRYNDSSGSNTLCSGAGGTPVNGSAASATGASNTLALGGTYNLSAFAVDEDPLYTPSVAGERHFFTVASFNPSAAACTSITTNEAIGATTFSSANWAMGGFRQTMQEDSTREDWEDFIGWNVELNDDGDFTVSTLDPAELGLVGGEAVWRTASGFTTRARLTSGAAKLYDGSLVSGRSLKFEDLDISTETGSGTWEGFVVRAGAGTLRLARCALDIRWDVVAMIGNDHFVDIEECDIRSRAQTGIYKINGTGNVRIVRTRIHDTVTAGIALGFTTGSGAAKIQETMIYGCGGAGVFINTGGPGVSIDVSHVSVYGCTGDGISINGTLARPQMIRIDNPIIENCANGIINADANAADAVLVESPTYYNLLAGSPVEESNITSIRKTTASASCFADAANGDFSPSAQVDDEGRLIA